MLNEASKAGLVLGIIPVLYSLAGEYSAPLTAASPILAGLVATVLWCLKFFGCIWLFYYFMKRYFKIAKTASKGIADTSPLTGFGLLTSLLSALVFAGYTLLDVAVLSPEKYAQSINDALAGMRSSMDSNSLAAMDGIMDKLPAISFVSVLIYCFLFGAILTAILAPRIVRKDFESNL